MFFIISKILAFLTTPIIWIVGLLFFSAFTKNAKRKKKTFIASILLVLFFSNSFIFGELMRLWEVPATKYEALDKYDAGIVLGGMLFYDKGYDRIQFYKGTDRMLQAIELYKRGYIKKIFFVGGSGSIVDKDIKEGPLVKRYLLTLGIPEQDIIIEGESKNTRENALFSKSILDSLHLTNGKLLLITSGFHLRRSAACFKKVGINTYSYSTDRFTGEERRWVFDYLFLPNADALENWNCFLHELVGCGIYFVAGYL